MNGVIFNRHSGRRVATRRRRCQGGVLLLLLLLRRHQARACLGVQSSAFPILNWFYFLSFGCPKSPKSTRSCPKLPENTLKLPKTRLKIAQVVGEAIQVITYGLLKSSEDHRGGGTHLLRLSVWECDSGSSW